MSFSQDVKKEIFEFQENKRHCNIAELLAIINCNGAYWLNKTKNTLKIQTENKYVAEKCYYLIQHLFGILPEVLVRLGGVNKSSKVYIIFVDGKQATTKILSAVGIVSGAYISDIHIDSLIVSSMCCKRAYIRSAFLCAGSLANPEKAYHLEFVNYDYDLAYNLKELLRNFGIEPKIIERKNQYVVYVKEGEQIVDLLNIMSAHKSLLELENVRVLKDVRNNVNRIVNCETANLNKIVSASVKQREAIEYIKSRVGLEYLPIQLREVAYLRLEYPDSSLKELGGMLIPPVGKSGVNHRLKKINTIAEKLREEHLL